MSTHTLLLYTHAKTNSNIRPHLRAPRERRIAMHLNYTHTLTKYTHTQFNGLIWVILWHSHLTPAGKVKANSTNAFNNTNKSEPQVDLKSSRYVGCKALWQITKRNEKIPSPFLFFFFFTIYASLVRAKTTVSFWHSTMVFLTMNLLFHIVHTLSL